ncbi:DUF4031 domain-containing protein [Terrihabitans sp. B22-R8]|uniref:DUF4031 domain-containing protein n=1 Tax=Terrihabitans sp. B22-R8 TaxID=3425128 RepID=UPI00403C6DBA
MILTCNLCTRQLAFAGTDPTETVRLYGWRKSGERYLCSACNPPVYVDALQFAKGQRWCHLFCEDRARLHAFAARLGLKRWRFHNERWPHYDLTPRQRAMALQIGAVAADRATTCEVAARLEHRKARAA